MGLFGCCCGGCPTWRQFVALVVPARVLAYYNCCYSTFPTDCTGCGTCPYTDMTTPLVDSDYQDAIDAGIAVVESANFNSPPAPGTPDPTTPNWSSNVYASGCPDFRINLYLLTPNPTPGAGVSYYWFPDDPVTFDPSVEYVLKFTYSDCNPFTDPSCQKLIGPGCGGQLSVFDGYTYGGCTGISSRVWISQASQYSGACTSERKYLAHSLSLPAAPDTLATAGILSCGFVGAAAGNVLVCSPTDAVVIPPSLWDADVQISSHETADWWIKFPTLDCICP